jgi:flagellar basal-body rod protein FlgG
MTGALYAVVSGSLAAVERLEVAANNLANVGTAGFKQQFLRIRAMDPDGLAITEGTGTIAETAEGTTTAITYETVTDFSQGVIRESGNALDAALVGPGFFVVNTPQGERYTRQGQFQLGPDGTLLTAAGFRLQGTNRQDLRLSAGAVEIETDGAVRVDGVRVGALRLVGFEDAERVLRPEGGGLFTRVGDVVPQAIDRGETRVAPKAIELSNVNAVEGLLELIDVARGYEAYMRAMQQVDGTVETAIREVGGTV